MNVFESEFFDTIGKISDSTWTLRCIVCNGHFDANYRNGYNTSFSIRRNSVIAKCPICGNAADTFVGECERTGIDNSDVL